MSNFWQQLNKPIFCLAPMEEVTDVVFREMFARYSGQGLIRRHSEGVRPTEESHFGDPSPLAKPRGFRMTPVFNNFVMFTEFINVDGTLHPTGFERLKIDLEYTENQRPIVAQIWGTDPEKFYEAAKLMVKMGFDGIDINMGCPQDKEIGIGACAALIRNPSLASEIIEATIRGCSAGPRPANSKKAGQGPALQEHNQLIPVSVKTRTGYSKPETEAWIAHLLKHNLAVITLHARTKQEKSKVPASWVEVKKAVDVRNSLQSKTLIIGNGDVKSREEGLQRIAETGCDGVMIARGAFGNPWLFNSSVVQATGLPISDVKQASGLRYITPQERLNVMLEHARLFNEKLGSKKSFMIMRKHFKAYASGFDGASEIRAKLLETKSLGEAEEIVEKYLEILGY